MKIKIAIAILILTTLSCQPPKTTPPAESKGMVPYNLSAVMRDGGFDLAWQCDIDGNISGYNIYASEKSLIENYPDGLYPETIRPVNRPVFPGDTDHSDGIEHYTAAGLDNGKTYYVTVRTVFPDRTESKPAQEIRIIPGPSGEITLIERFKGANDGWSFEKSQYVSADDMLNDIFFYQQNGSDYLASPTRLDGFLNQTLLIRLPYKGTFEEVRPKVNQSDNRPTKDRVEVSSGDWVLARLASGEHALIKVSSFQRTAEQAVTLEYYTCALAGEVYF